nr:immunoglobulin light chain junction region [Macaca mulatta]
DYYCSVWHTSAYLF